jgi:hypothetical protein
MRSKAVRLRRHSLSDFSAGHCAEPLGFRAQRVSTADISHIDDPQPLRLIIRQLQSENQNQAHEIASLLQGLENADHSANQSSALFIPLPQVLRTENIHLQEALLNCHELTPSHSSADSPTSSENIYDDSPLRTDHNDSDDREDPDDRGDHTDCDDAVSDGEPSESSADSVPEGDEKSCHIEEQFLEVCTENGELREQVSELQAQLSRVMCAHVHSMSDELELVQAESQGLRQQAFALQVLREENSRLRHRIIALETQQLDYQSQLAPGGLQWRGRELESIIAGIDEAHPASDDREQLGFFADEMSERLTEVERRFNELSLSNERLAECRAENAKLRSEMAALREGPSLDLCVETERLLHERNELETEIGRLKTARDALAVDDLQMTIDSLTSERDELGRRVREQAVLLETVGTSLDENESKGQGVFGALKECLSIIRNSQEENMRANEELRSLHCQVHELKEEKAVLTKQLEALKAQ